MSKYFLIKVNYVNFIAPATKPCHPVDTIDVKLDKQYGAGRFYQAPGSCESEAIDQVVRRIFEWSGQKVHDIDYTIL